MVLKHLGACDQVSHQISIWGDINPQGILYCSHGADGMDRRSDASYTLCEEPGISGIAIIQDQLQSSEHRTAAPGIAHIPAIDFHFDTKVALDPGHRINRNSSHSSSSLVCSGRSTGSVGTFPLLLRNALPRACKPMLAAVKAVTP
jgi:hypothetical protein